MEAQCVTYCAWPLPPSVMLLVIRWSMCQHLVSNSWMIFRCSYVRTLPLTFIHSRRHWGCFHHLTIVNSTTINFHVQVFIWYLFSIFKVYIQKQNCQSYVILHLTLSGTIKLFSKWPLHPKQLTLRLWTISKSSYYYILICCTPENSSFTILLS